MRTNLIDGARDQLSQRNAVTREIDITGNVDLVDRDLLLPAVFVRHCRVADLPAAGSDGLFALSCGRKIDGLLEELNARQELRQNRLPGLAAKRLLKLGLEDRVAHRVSNA